MERYRTVDFRGTLVHVIEAKSDGSHMAQISIIAEKFNDTPMKLVSEFRDETLEAEGWRKIGVVNGGLWFQEGTSYFAEGIERSNWVTHEFDDAGVDSCMGFYHINDLPYVVKQSYMKPRLNNYRGAIIGTFGLLNNGIVDISGGKIGEKHRSHYIQRSGRTIVGKKKDGTIMLASFYGVTGESGLTGWETVELARFLGLHNALCMDGGGSVGMLYKNDWKVQTNRKAKQGIAIYVKDVSIEVGDTIRFKDDYTVSAINGANPNLIYLQELGVYVDAKNVEKV